MCALLCGACCFLLFMLTEHRPSEGGEKAPPPETGPGWGEAPLLWQSPSPAPAGPGSPAWGGRLLHTVTPEAAQGVFPAGGEDVHASRWESPRRACGACGYRGRAQHAGTDGGPPAELTVFLPTGRGEARQHRGEAPPDGGAVGGEEPGTAAGTCPSRKAARRALLEHRAQVGGGGASFPASPHPDAGPLLDSVRCSVSGLLRELSAGGGTHHMNSVMSALVAGEESGAPWAVLPGCGDPTSRCSDELVSGTAPRAGGISQVPLHQTGGAGWGPLKLRGRRIILEDQSARLGHDIEVPNSGHGPDLHPKILKYRSRHKGIGQDGYS